MMITGNPQPYAGVYGYHSSPEFVGSISEVFYCEVGQDQGHEDVEVDDDAVL